MYETHQFCKPVPIPDLIGTGSGVAWLWEGLLAKGRITLLSAQAKAGKTTLLALLIREMASGGHLLGCEVQPGRVLVISEEAPDEWILRREQHEIGRHAYAVCLPFLGKPTIAQWQQLLSETLIVIGGERLDLIVFDTLSHLWPVLNENDNGEQQRAIMPARALTEAGACVLLVHHAGAAGERVRGATELEGFVDQLAHMQLAEPLKPDSRARTLLVRGRLTGSPVKLRIELTPDGQDYQVIEGNLKPVRSELWATMETLVPDQPPGWTLQDFRGGWPIGPRVPSAEAMRMLVHRYAKKCGWNRTDERPPRYWKPRYTTETEQQTGGQCTVPALLRSDCCDGEKTANASISTPFD
jgi:hypothetical protein